MKINDVLKRIRGNDYIYKTEFNFPKKQVAKAKSTEEALSIIIPELDKAMRNAPERKRTNYTILTETVLYLRVCSSMNAPDLTKLINEDYPPGTEGNKWELATGPLPGSGDAPVVQCNEAEGKKHYVFEC